MIRAAHSSEARPPNTQGQGPTPALFGVRAEGETQTHVTPKRQGHWRCVFWVNTDVATVEIHPNARWLSDTEIVAGPQWPSEEVADERGRADVQVLPKRFRPYVCYIRAEYFPDYA